MLSTSLRAAPHHCLRCQLRQIIFPRLRPFPTAPSCFDPRRAGRVRGFAVSSRQRAGEGQKGILSSRDDDGSRRRQSRFDDGPLGEQSGDGSSTTHLPQTQQFPSRRELLANHDDNSPSSSADEVQDGDTAGDHAAADEGRSIRAPRIDHVFGRAGRFQRVTSATLNTQAMGKPFEVTVMHDIDKPSLPTVEPLPDDHPRRALDLGMIERPPTKDEVIASIDALRPSSSMLTSAQFDHLARQLDDSYNPKQLSTYLDNALRLSATDAVEVEIKPSRLAAIKGGLQRSMWNPGISPIDERPHRGVVIKKGHKRTRKSIVIMQILRFAWQVKNVTEWQAIGELEISLKPWQFSYLFDVTEDGKPMHQTLIPAKLLREASKISHYRPDNIVRVTARRVDAEEIADQLEVKLQTLPFLRLDLKPVRPVLRKRGLTGRLANHLDTSICGEIASRTGTVVELEGERHLIIRGSSDAKLHAARRILRNFLSPASEEHITTLEPLTLDSDQLHPESSRLRVLALEHELPNLDLRYRGLRLGRLHSPIQLPTGQVMDDESSTVLPPCSKSQDNPSPDCVAAYPDLEQQQQYISPWLARLPRMPAAKQSKRSPWTPCQHNLPAPWRVQFCKLLYPPSGAAHATLPPVMHHKAPHISGLMSYFVPSESSSSLPNKSPQPSTRVLGRSAGAYKIIAHYQPSILQPDGDIDVSRLPPVQLIYRSGDLIRPQYVLAKLCTQEVRVPLPDQAVDLRFVRDLTMEAITAESHSAIGFDSVIAKAAQVSLDLQHNMEWSEDDIEEHFKEEFKRSFVATDVVKVKLPTWVVFPDRAKKLERLITVDYWFDRVEEIRHSHRWAGQQTAPAKDPLIVDMLRSVPDCTFVRCEEIDGGLADGWRCELNLEDELCRRHTTKFHLPSSVSQARKDGRAVNDADSGKLAESVEVHLAKGADRGEKLAHSALLVARAITGLSSERLKPSWKQSEQYAKAAVVKREKTT